MNISQKLFAEAFGRLTDKKPKSDLQECLDCNFRHEMPWVESRHGYMEKVCPRCESEGQKFLVPIADLTDEERLDWTNRKRDKDSPKNLIYELENLVKCHSRLMESNHESAPRFSEAIDDLRSYILVRWTNNEPAKTFAS